MEYPVKHPVKYPVRSAIAGAALLLAPAVAALAQSGVNNMQFNIAAGAALPTGDFGRFSDVGYNLTVGIGTRQRNSQLGFRVEGLYNEFSISGGGGNSHAGGVTANATFDLGGGGLGTGGLYVIGGVGYYNTDEPIFNVSNSQNNIGFNIGGGYRFPLTGFSAYVEARYHTIQNTDVHFVPIVFGLVF
jgi:hypothetical protein